MSEETFVIDYTDCLKNLNREYNQIMFEKQQENYFYRLRVYENLKALFALVEVVNNALKTHPEVFKTILHFEDDLDEEYQGKFRVVYPYLLYTVDYTEVDINSVEKCCQQLECRVRHLTQMGKLVPKFIKNIIQQYNMIPYQGTYKENKYHEQMNIFKTFERDEILEQETMPDNYDPNEHPILKKIPLIQILTSSL